MNKIYRETLISNIKNVLNDSEVASIFNNQALKGRAKEIFIGNLLKPYINPTISVCTGFATDYNGNQSNQIDIILFDKNIIPPLMLSEVEGIIPIESVLATIEIKSLLNSTEVLNSVKNARSIKTLEPFFAEIEKGNKIKKSPPCFVFAFKSNLKEKSEYERLKEIVDRENNGNEPVYVPLSGICIPKKVFLVCVKAEEEPIFEEINPTNDYDEVIEFLLHLVDTANLLSVERKKIFLTPYIKEI